MQEAGYNQDRSLVHRIARDKQPQKLTFTLTGRIKVPD